MFLFFIRWTRIHSLDSASYSRLKDGNNLLCAPTPRWWVIRCIVYYCNKRFICLYFIRQLVESLGDQVLLKRYSKNVKKRHLSQSTSFRGRFPLARWGIMITHICVVCARYLLFNLSRIPFLAVLVSYLKTTEGFSLEYSLSMIFAYLKILSPKLMMEKSVNSTAGRLTRYDDILFWWSSFCVDLKNLNGWVFKCWVAPCTNTFEMSLLRRAAPLPCHGFSHLIHIWN